MSETKTYIEEFLFRGRPEGSEQPASWHVVIGTYMDVDGHGRVKLGTDLMTPGQAAASGHTLESILEGIDAAVFTDADAVRAENMELKAHVEALTKENEELTSQLQGARQNFAESTDQVKDLQAAVKDFYQRHDVKFSTSQTQAVPLSQ